MTKFCPDCGTRLDGAANCPNCQKKPAPEAGAKMRKDGKRKMAVLAVVAAGIAIFAVANSLGNWKSRSEWRSLEEAESASDEVVASKAASDPVYMSELGIRMFNAAFEGKSGPIAPNDLEQVRKQVDEAGRILLRAREAVASGGKAGSAETVRTQGNLWQWWSFVNQFPETSAIYQQDSAFRARIDSYCGGKRP